MISEEEFRYWGLEATLLEPCCTLKYFPKTREAHQEIIEEINENRKADKREKEESFNTGPLRTFRSKLWDLLEYPETSRAAQFFAFTSIIFVILSTVSFISESFLEDYIATSTAEKLNKQLWSNHGYFEKDDFLILMSCSFYSCL